VIAAAEARDSLICAWFCLFFFFGGGGGGGVYSLFLLAGRLGLQFFIAGAVGLLGPRDGLHKITCSVLTRPRALFVKRRNW
jgi:hypothetical protein